MRRRYEEGEEGEFSLCRKGQGELGEGGRGKRKRGPLSQRQVVLTTAGEGKWEGKRGEEEGRGRPGLSSGDEH